MKANQFIVIVFALTVFLSGCAVKQESKESSQPIISGETKSLKPSISKQEISPENPVETKPVVSQVASNKSFMDRLSPECQKIILKYIDDFQIESKLFEGEDSRLMSDVLLNSIHSDFLNSINREHPGSNIKPKEFFTLIPRHHRAAFAASQLCMQVDNGGLLQFFWNTRNIYNDTIVEDLKYLGDEKSADVMKQAVELCIKRGDKMNPGKSGNVLVELSEVEKTQPYDDLEKKLNTKELEKLVCGFIKKNRKLYERKEIK